MKVTLAPRASQDIDRIADYILERNPAAARRVREAIEETLEIAAAFPELGISLISGRVRRLVVRRFGYLVYDRIDRRADRIFVLSVRHPKRRRVLE